MTTFVPGLTVSCLALATAVVAGSHATAQVEKPKSTAPIRIELGPDKKRYKSGERIRADVILRNVGSSRLYVDSRMYWAGLGNGIAVQVLDERHLPVSPRFWAHMPVPPPAPSDTTVLIRLEAGAFYGTSIGCSVDELLPHPGKYFLRVLYESILNPDFIAPSLRELPVYWSDMPGIQSELVPVERIR